MIFRVTRTMLGATGIVLVGLLGVVSAGGRAAAAGQNAQNQQMAEDVLIDIQVLRGIPLDEFMDTMGMFTSALGYDCSDCHGPGIAAGFQAYAEPTPQLLTARRMIVMMNAINESYFGGAERVTCFTCHNGDFSPKDAPDLSLQYGVPRTYPNAMEIFPTPGASADQIFDDYMQALGGREQVASLTSFVATGTYSGFDTRFAGIPLEIYAEAPDRRTTIIRGLAAVDSIRTYDGSKGWKAGSDVPVPSMALTEANLAGARIEALASFPAGIQQAYSEWEAGTIFIDDRMLQVVQGRNAGGSPVNLYFDESGLLVRLVRWNETAVGVIPTQTVYEDYREVSGSQMPFRWTVTWTGGQSIFELTDVQPNVPIDASRFARPTPAASP